MFPPRPIQPYHFQADLIWGDDPCNGCQINAGLPLVASYPAQPEHVLAWRQLEHVETL